MVKQGLAFLRIDAKDTDENNKFSNDAKDIISRYENWNITFWENVKSKQSGISNFLRKIFMNIKAIWGFFFSRYHGSICDVTSTNDLYPFKHYKTIDSRIKDGRDAYFYEVTYIDDNGRD